MNRYARTLGLVAFLWAPRLASAGMVPTAVANFFSPVAQFTVPAPLRSCMTPADPSSISAFKAELGGTLTDVLRPDGRELRAPLAASMSLRSEREMDQLFFGLMPRAAANVERLRSARAAKDKEAALKVLEDMDAEYQGAVKGFAYAVGQSYEKGAMDASQLRQARLAMEEYTGKGSFARDTLDLLRGLEKAASAARDAATMGFARGQAHALLNSLSGDASFPRPEPAVYADRANVPISFFEPGAVVGSKDVAQPANSSDLILDRLEPALRKLRPDVGQEVLIARFSVKDYLTDYAGTLLHNEGARRDMIARVKARLRESGERAGIRVLFLDEVADLSVDSDNAVILSLRHSKDEEEYSLLGMKSVSSSYRLEAYLVGSKRPAANVLIPKPVPIPLMERLHLDQVHLGSLVKLVMPVFAAYGAAHALLVATKFLSTLPVWSQPLVIAAALLGVAGLAKLALKLMQPSWKSRFRVLEILLIGAGLYTIVGFARKLLFGTATGIALVGWLSRLFGL